MSEKVNFEGLPFDIEKPFEENIKTIEKYAKTNSRKPDTLVNLEMCREYISRYLLSCTDLNDMKPALGVVGRLDRVLTNNQKAMAKQSERYINVINWKSEVELPTRKAKLKESKQESNILLSITGLLGLLFIITYMYTKPVFCYIVLFLEVLWCVELYFYNKRKHLMTSSILSKLFSIMDKKKSTERYERAMIYKTELLEHKMNTKLSPLASQMINSKQFDSYDVRFIEKVYENVIEMDRK